MKFSDLYNNTAKNLNLILNEEDLETANVQPVVDTEETKSISAPNVSQLDVEEEKAQKVVWIEKIIKLLTLLNREDNNVEQLINNLTEKDTNADTLEEKEKIINNLISTLNPSSK
jgi:hypothetical protein